MKTLSQPSVPRRYKRVSKEKSDGATYTPPILAAFVARQIVKAASIQEADCPIHVLDPAVGDGALLVSLVEALRKRTRASIVVHGFDTNQDALDTASRDLTSAYPDVELRLEFGSFLDFTLSGGAPHLFSEPAQRKFDLIIANPPYVRTQIMGSEQAQILASAFGLAGRVDLYHAFLIAMAQVLEPGGTAGIIVSNRFMTTKGGASVRAALRERFSLKHVWDFGDTKLFDAAVLPAVILAQGCGPRDPTGISFSSIYETSEPASSQARNAIDAMESAGTVALADGRRFHVQHGTLHSADAADAVWRIATDAGDEWLATVESRTWATFQSIGKIRVGVKTCADKIYIRSDWLDPPELLRPLTTHHVAGRFRAVPAKRPQRIIYPHGIEQGRRKAVDLDLYPKSKAYLESHREALEARTYLMEGGRSWYEIWVPQDPEAWKLPKLVFRDITARPTFWIDLDGTIINGDCYWMMADNSEDQELLWLAAAVANSTFSEAFYDHRFNNKLYAGRRRYMSQYVEQFPLPDPATPTAQQIIAASKRIYEIANTAEAEALEAEISGMVWSAFGVSVKVIVR